MGNPPKYKYGGKYGNGTEHEIPKGAVPVETTYDKPAPAASGKSPTRINTLTTPGVTAGATKGEMVGSGVCVALIAA